MRETKEVTKESFPGKALHAGAQVAVTAERVKEQLNHVVEDSVAAARRTARRARHAAEDLADETAYRIKREPLGAVATVFGIGFGLGALTGLLVAQRVGRKS